MTRLASLLLIFIVIASSSFRPATTAQKMNLCKSITHIANAFSENKINDLLGEASKGDDDDVTIYDSKIDIDGLEDEFVADSENETVFFATYLNASSSKLKAKFTELKNQISKCLNKSFETSKLDAIETASFTYDSKVTVELTIYHEDNEIDLNIEVSKSR